MAASWTTPSTQQVLVCWGCVSRPALDEENPLRMILTRAFGNLTADGKELWMRIAKGGAARREKTRKDMNAKMLPYSSNNGRRTPGARRTRVKHGAVRPKR